MGAYLWSSARFGVDVEVDYNVIAEETLVHELLFAVGPVHRF